MGSLLGKSGTVVVIILVLLVLAALFSPQIRRVFLNLRAEEVSIAAPSARTNSGSQTVDLKIITVLGRDGIPAILEPIFITAPEAQAQMRPTERVMGVSINGDNRAYPLNLLSRHEIVNDTVGGEAVAVTW